MEVEVVIEGVGRYFKRTQPRRRFFGPAPTPGLEITTLSSTAMVVRERRVRRWLRAAHGRKLSQVQSWKVTEC